MQPEVAGHLLEGFVAGELRRQQGWSEELVRISHYRDHAGDEVDLILETEDGRVAGIEVKASSSIRRHDGKWLAKLRDRLGIRFTAGLVLHIGSSSTCSGRGDALWLIDEEVARLRATLPYFARVGGRGT